MKTGQSVCVLSNIRGQSHTLQIQVCTTCLLLTVRPSTNWSNRQRRRKRGFTKRKHTGRTETERPGPSAEFKGQSEVTLMHSRLLAVLQLQLTSVLGVCLGENSLQYNNKSTN